MPITNQQIADMPDYSDAELLKLTRKAIAEIMLGGQSMGVNGRQLTRADLAELWESVRMIEDRITAAGSTESDSAGIVLARTGKPQ